MKSVIFIYIFKLFLEQEAIPKTSLKNSNSAHQMEALFPEAKIPNLVRNMLSIEGRKRANKGPLMPLHRGLILHYTLSGILFMMYLECFIHDV